MADTLAREAQLPVTTECTGLAPVPICHQPCAAWRAATLALFIAWSAPAAAEGFGASWTGDFATVASGGLDRGDRHMGLVELTFDDGFVFAGRGNSLHLSVQHVYGGGFSEFQVGDLQTVSNIDADDGTRLFEAWVEVPLSESSSVLLGRYDLNTEFDAIEAGGLFLSSSQGVGPDISQTGAAGPSIFPRTASASSATAASGRSARAASCSGAASGRCSATATSGAATAPSATAARTCLCL